MTRALTRSALLIALLTRSGRADEWDKDYEGWFQVYVEQNLDVVLPKLRASADLHARFFNTPRAFGPDTAANMNPNVGILLRPAVGYQLTPFASAWLGYAWTPIWFIRADRTDISEHRVWEQLTLTHTLGPVTLTSRTRIEQRVRDAGGEGAGQGQWALRGRELVRAQWTLVPKKPWMLIAWDELFVHLSSTGVFAANPDGTRRPVGYPSEIGFDQNRAFLGIGYQASGAFRFEIGYLNQIVQRFGRSPDQLNHALFAGAYFKLD